jgi:hypothetical protein
MCSFGGFGSFETGRRSLAIVSALSAVLRKPKQELAALLIWLDQSRR